VIRSFVGLFAPPLSQWREFAPFIKRPIDASTLNSAADKTDLSVSGVGTTWHIGQTPSLLADGLHYERRIADRRDRHARGRWRDCSTRWSGCAIRR
jgi:hypothetical protein